MKPAQYWLPWDTSIQPRVAFVLSQEEFDAVFRDAGSTEKTSWISGLNAAVNATTTWTTDCDGIPFYVVSLVPKPGVAGLKIAALLVHEAVHVFQYHCEYLGETAPSKEFEAYSIQFIAQALMQKYADRLEFDSLV